LYLLKNVVNGNFEVQLGIAEHDAFLLGPVGLNFSQRMFSSYSVASGLSAKVGPFTVLRGESNAA